MIYRNRETGQTFIKYYDATLEDPLTGLWVDCVVYVPRSDPTDKHVVLAKVFDERFRVVGLRDGH